MQAVFRFDAYTELVVSNQVNGVMVEVIRAVRPGVEGAPQERVPLSLATEEQRRSDITVYARSQARAIASAIMGAAAEL